MVSLWELNHYTIYQSNMFNAHFSFTLNYYRSGNIREVIIFVYFARRTNSRIQESRENYYYNNATKENKKSRILIFVKVVK